MSGVVGVRRVVTSDLEISMFGLNIYEQNTKNVTHPPKIMMTESDIKGKSTFDSAVSLKLASK